MFSFANHILFHSVHHDNKQWNTTAIKGDNGPPALWNHKSVNNLFPVLWLIIFLITSIHSFDLTFSLNIFKIGNILS